MVKELAQAPYTQMWVTEISALFTIAVPPETRSAEGQGLTDQLTVGKLRVLREAVGPADVGKATRAPWRGCRTG
jgi:hypothetical protein